MAVLGDERLFALLEADGEAIARGDPDAIDGGRVAELVERAGWAKVEIVSADERERGNAGGPDHAQPGAFDRACGRGGGWLSRPAPR
jgi:hypothetical protein